MATTLTTKELRNMQTAELQKDLSDKRQALSKLKLSVQLQKEKDTSKLKVLRREAARILTVLNEKNGSQKPSKELKAEPKASSMAAPKKRKTSSSPSA